MPELTATDVEQYTAGRLSADDPQTELALAAALAAARRYCGWHVCPVMADQVSVIDGPGSPLLVLPTLRLVTLSKITEQGVEADLDFVQVSERGLARKLSGFPAQPANSDWWNWYEYVHPAWPYLDYDREIYWTGGYSTVEVTMTHGYDDALDWQAAVLSFTERAVRAATTGGLLIHVGPFRWSETQDQASGGSTFTAAELAILQSYRLEPPA